MRHYCEPRRVLLALAMAGVTGTATSTLGALSAAGATAAFFHEFRVRFTIAYPTIVCCIIFVAPHVQAWIDRMLAGASARAAR
ncbi:MAG: hypothetical protein DI582_10240 [Azospirillum brasilense]|nr:MAG: hypothetical protein DI582_10240 [Azospirillum brasilense]